MKVALLHGYVGGPAGGGGGIRQMLELARGLDQLGHEPVILGYQFEPGTIDPQIERRFEFLAVERGKIHHPKSQLQIQRVKWRGMKQLADLIPADVDAVNVHEVPVYMAGAFAKRRLKVPVVWTRNDATLYEQLIMPEESWEPRPSKPLELAYRFVGQSDRRAIRSLDAICVLDQRNRRMVERAFGRDAQVIQSGAAPRFFDAPSRAEARARLGIDSDEFAVLSVGILLPHRRHQDTVKAIGLMPAEGRRTKLRLIGSDHFSPETGAELRELVAADQLADRVELIQTAVSDADLVAHFAAADAFVFANQRQTWGLAPLEAIAAGTAVVVSRGAGVHEVLDGHQGVQLVDPQSPQQIAGALQRIKDDPAAYDVSETRAWTRKQFSAEAYARRMLELFETA